MKKLTLEFLKYFYSMTNVKRIDVNIFNIEIFAKSNNTTFLDISSKISSYIWTRLLFYTKT